ncbi:hypothetical protein [Paenibacillus luteus]|nr:hypothetical protein [Paenibacillus luteus]
MSEKDKTKELDFDPYVLDDSFELARELERLYGDDKEKDKSDK